jgi:hypothetical protein
MCRCAIFGVYGYSNVILWEGYACAVAASAAAAVAAAAAAAAAEDVARENQALRYFLCTKSVIFIHSAKANRPLVLCL